MDQVACVISKLHLASEFFLFYISDTAPIPNHVFGCTTINQKCLATRIFVYTFNIEETWMERFVLRTISLIFLNIFSIDLF